MTVQQFKIDFTGQQLDPRFGHMLTNNTLAEVVVPGYLNTYMENQGFTVKTTDFIFVAASNGNQIYKPVISSLGVVTLTVLP